MIFKVLVLLSLLFVCGCTTTEPAYLYSVTVIVNPNSEDREEIELYPVIVGNGKTRGYEYYGFDYTNVNPKVHVRQSWFLFDRRR